MQRDDEALALLKDHIAKGRSYYEATTLLSERGFSQLEIHNATAALKSGRNDTSFNESLADSLAHVASAETDSNANAAHQRGMGRPSYPGGGLPLTHVGGSLNSWWYLVPFGVVLLVMGYLLLS